MINYVDKIKSRLTIRQVAERYGYKVKQKEFYKRSVCNIINNLFGKKSKEKLRCFLKYDMITELPDGSQLWFEPITDEIDGIILRGEDDRILGVFEEIPRRETENKEDING